jgi:site-specific recombinase XerD
MLTYCIVRARLTVNEVARMINDTRELNYQIFILTAYRLGLGLNETLILRVGKIDNKRMKSHIRTGKGNRCRFVNLFTQTFQALQTY